MSFWYWFSVTLIYILFAVLSIELLNKNKKIKPFLRLIGGLSISYSAFQHILELFSNILLPFDDPIKFYFLSIIILLIIILSYTIFIQKIKQSSSFEQQVIDILKAYEIQSLKQYPVFKKKVASTKLMYDKKKIKTDLTFEGKHSLEGSFTFDHKMELPATLIHEIPNRGTYTTDYYFSVPIYTKSSYGEDVEKILKNVLHKDLEVTLKPNCTDLIIHYKD